MRFIPKTLAVCGVGVLVAVGAQAQTHPPTNPSSAQPLQPAVAAPVGHRQPNATDVPRDVLSSEGTVSNRMKELDQKLNICRGC